MADEVIYKEKYVGYKSLNSLVGRIKYENELQNTEIDSKMDDTEGMTVLDIDTLWNIS